MERTFKWQDLAYKLRQMVFCLTFLLLCGISIGNAAVEVGFIYLGDKGDFTAPALEFAEKTFKNRTTRESRLEERHFQTVWGCLVARRRYRSGCLVQRRN